MTTPRQQMGLEVPGDQKVPVPVRDWEAMKRAVWRTGQALEIAGRQAAEILGRCNHLDGCPGKTSETEPCFGGINAKEGELGCPDREIRMSALVILNAARQFAPVDARKPADAPYYAPSREYFSEVLATLAAAQMELDSLRTPTAAPPPQLKENT